MYYRNRNREESCNGPASHLKCKKLHLHNFWSAQEKAKFPQYPLWQGPNLLENTQKKWHCYSQNDSNHSLNASDCAKGMFALRGYNGKPANALLTISLLLTIGSFSWINSNPHANHASFSR